MPPTSYRARKAMQKAGIIKVKVVPKKRKNKRKVRNVVYNRGPSLIPDTYISKMNYTFNITQKAQMEEQIVGPSAETRFLRLSGNSIYDPDDTTVFNGWPVGYAEMQSFYRKFYVSACSVKVDAICSNGNLADSFRIILYPSNRDTINNIPFNSLVSNPYSTPSTYFGPAFGKNICTKRIFQTTKSITGRKNPVSENDYHGELSGPIDNGDPKEQWYIYVICQTNNDTWTEDNLKLNVEMTYHTMFYDRRQQRQDNDNTIGELDELVPDTSPPLDLTTLNGGDVPVFVDRP